MRAALVSMFLLSASLFAAPPTPAVAAPSSHVEDFVAAGVTEPLPEPIARGVAAITAPRLAAHIAFLASDALAGRGLGSEGLAAATEYVVATLRLAGVAPLSGPDDSRTPAGYFQAVPLREIKPTGGQVEVEVGRGDWVGRRTFLAGVDCSFGEVAPQSIRSEVTFVGFGIREPALGRDDYRGVEVSGKIVLVKDGLPPGDEWRTPELSARWAPEKRRERWTAKLKAAEAAGAVAVLAIEDQPLAAGGGEDEHDGERFFEAADAPWPARSPLLVRVSPALAAALLGRGQGGGPIVSRRTQLLEGIHATITVHGEERSVLSRNVLAVIPGSDQALRENAVVIGAHMDHLGRIGDKVYPGADDNASGVSALLEIAGSFAAAQPRPKRTVVLAFWTGEEEGKLGSGYYVRHPVWPLARTTAYLNLDMIGHPWSMSEIRTLVLTSGLANPEAFTAKLDPADFVEPGVAEWSSELGETLRRAAHGTGLAVHLDWTDGKNGGSDYRDFARAGTPFVRFFGNFFPAYHEPGDTADQLDPAQVQRVARLALATAWLLADR